MLENKQVVSYTSHYRSPLGGITLASNGDALVGIWWNGQKYFGKTLGREVVQRAELPVFDETRHWLDIYFSGHEPDFTPSLLLHGTDFQHCVWKQLLTIPYGHTVSYGELARQLGIRSAQAVGGAVGRNPVSIIVPCHRVIGTNGNLTGYASGLERKRALLQLEQKNYFAR